MTASAPMPNTLAAVVATARRFFDEAIAYRGVAPALEAEIAANARALTMRLARPLSLVGVASSLAWWPTDPWFYAGEPDVLQAFATWRGLTIAICLTFFLTANRWEFLRRHVMGWATLLSVAMIAECAWITGGVGGADRPWFALFYFSPFMAFPVFFKPVPRLLATFALNAAAFWGSLLSHPENLARAPVATIIGLLVFTTFIGSAMGHALYHVTRVSFLQARELELLTRTLSERVRERTEELRMLAAHVENLRESERGALARELHDELGQILTGMRVELDLAENRLARGGDVAAQHARLAELLDATLASARSLLSRLRPRVLDDFGIVAALEWLAADTKRRSRLDITFSAHPPELELAPDVATAVFRIAQESLTNVIRHAEAKTVRVALSLGAEGLRLTITDDGRGLPPPQERRRASMGLVGMRERAQALGGTLTLESNGGGGTTVTMHVPVVAAAEATQEAA